MTNKALTLTKTVKGDLYTLFQFQLDNEANILAAFTAKHSHSQEAYIEKYSQFLHDPTNNTQTIKVDNEIVGSIAKFIMFGDMEITYWIDKMYWGQGIATAALQEFLKIENARPIHGRVALDNYGSQRVLEKCGFVKIGTDRGFANARQMEIEEFIHRLDA